MSDEKYVLREELAAWCSAMVERLRRSPASAVESPPSPAAAPHPPSAKALGREIEAMLVAVTCMNGDKGRCYNDHMVPHRLPDMRAAALFCTSCRARWHLRAAMFELVGWARNVGTGETAS